MKKSILLAGLLMASNVMADISTRSDGKAAWAQDQFGRVYFCMLERQEDGTFGPICYEAKMENRS